MDIIPVFGTVVGGSNPSESTSLLLYKEYRILVTTCGYGLVVECVLAKDETGVRFSLPAHISVESTVMSVYKGCV
jgi:hypothetical protein